MPLVYISEGTRLVLMPLVDIIRRYQACVDASGGHNQKVLG